LDPTRLKQAIDLYEASIEEAVRDIRNAMILDLVYISWTIVMIALSLSFANLAGIMTAFGLSGATIATQSRKWLDAIKAFFSKSGQLRRTVGRLRTEYAMCSPTDEPCLDKVRDLLRSYMDALEEAAKTQQ